MKQYQLFTVVLGCVILLNTTLSGQVPIEQCSQYGDNPTEFTGQKCWLRNYLSSNIAKYNNNQKLDQNFILHIPLVEVDDFFHFDKGENTAYLDANNMAWGSFWYPCKFGGIANKYHSQYGSFTSSSALKWENIKAMTADQLFKLSPAEKLDILLGNKDFNITNWELHHRGPERGTHEDDGFCGYCNGSRVAGALLPEPQHNIVMRCEIDNAIKITFTPSDIKAIAAAAYMHPTYYMGLGVPDIAGNNDPNPALVDIMLRLYLGKYGMPFFIDADPGPDLYNETVLGFDRKITNTRDATQLEKTSNSAIDKVNEINTTLFLQDELTIEQSNSPTIPILINKNMALATKSSAASYHFWVHTFNICYLLYTDAAGKILDGKWIKHKLIPSSTRTVNGKNTVVPAHYQDFDQIDFMWAANGAGNEENSEQALNPGNKFLKFAPVLTLIDVSTRQIGDNQASPYVPNLPEISKINKDVKFQAFPANLRVRQNVH